MNNVNAMEGASKLLCSRGGLESPLLRTMMIFFVALLLGFLVVVALLFCVYFMLAVFTGAPFLPTGKNFVAKMVTVAQVQPGDTFIDLGSGDGRVVLAAAKQGARAIGYEINPFLVWIARLRIRTNGLRDRAEIRWQSLWSADLRAANVVSIFGISGMMPRLEHKLDKELPEGARVVSYVFSLPTWKPVHHEEGVRLYRR